MRYFVMWVLGFLPGLVAGVGLLKLFITFAKNECKYVLDKAEDRYSNKRFNQCPGRASDLCLEKLCPTHCQQVHQGKCTQKAFRTAA